METNKRNELLKKLNDDKLIIENEQKSIQKKVFKVPVCKMINEDVARTTIGEIKNKYYK